MFPTFWMTNGLDEEEEEDQASCSSHVARVRGPWTNAKPRFTIQGSE